MYFMQKGSIGVGYNLTGSLSRSCTMNAMTKHKEFASFFKTD